MVKLLSVTELGCGALYGGGTPQVEGSIYFSPISLYGGTEGINWTRSFKDSSPVAQGNAGEFAAFAASRGSYLKSVTIRLG